MTQPKVILPWPGVGRSRHVADPPSELIARVAHGDQEAFSALYDALAPRVFGMCRRVLRNGAQAEEVTQEVMVEVWRTAARYDSAKGSVSSWVLTMAHRRAIDLYRSRRTTAQRERLYATKDAEPAYDRVAEKAIAHAEAGHVRDCLDALTALQREAIMLAYYDGHTYPEVAQALDIKLPTVKGRIRDGLRRLRDCLAPLGVT